MQRVVATAPVRVCDVGGWTDTWFGSPGQVCSIPVGPGVTVTAERHEREPGDGASGLPVHVVAPDIGVDHWFGPAADGDWSRPTPSVEPLLEHAVAHVLEAAAARGVAPPADEALTVTISSAVPPGASLGTSAAVVVAVLGALGALLGPDDVDDGADTVWFDELEGLDDSGRGEVDDVGGGGELGDVGGGNPLDLGQRRAPALARAAHLLETQRAGRESGVQDHWAAALGGPLHLTIDTYPDVRWRRFEVAAATRAELGDRLVTVVFGAHDSSAIHGGVIHALLSCDGVAHDRVRRETRLLASLAADAAAALEGGDLGRWTEVLVAATAAQARMHPGLVGLAHTCAIDLARSAGAVGWKVNGAGGDGGSLTLVAPPGGADAIRRALVDGGDRGWQVLDLMPADRGLVVVRG